MSTPSVNYLVDSSIFITYLRGRQDIVLRLDGLPNKFISPTVIAELAFGARRSRDPQRALANVNKVVGPLPVVDIRGDIGADFAEVKNGLVVPKQTRISCGLVEMPGRWWYGSGLPAQPGAHRWPV